MEFLNRGGTPQAVIEILSWTDKQGLAPDSFYDSSTASKDQFNETHLFQRDLTGDGIPEFIVSRVNLYVFGCRNGKYEILLEVDNDDWVNKVAAPWIIVIDDLNADGLPEIIVKSYAGNFGGTMFRIFEWHADRFASLIHTQATSRYSTESDAVSVPVGEVILDAGSDGTKQIVFRGYELLTYGLPSRGEQFTYGWNETNFVLLSKEYSEPVYRFEAVQDGDRYFLSGDYDRAISSYQDAILSDKLDWWSYERNRYEVNCVGLKPNCPYFPTPPAVDPEEYYSLAAYSRFRIMVIYVLRGRLSDATTTYNEIQAQYLEGQAGHAHAEMARQFWAEYRATENVGSACKKAIEYARAHPADILAYLGNGDYAFAYYGEQSLRYTPEDVCPAK